MAADYELLGLSPRYHPLGLLRARLPDHLITTADLERLPNRTLVQIAGLAVCRQRPGTAKGITFILLEDELGLVNLIVYPNLYEERRTIVRGEPFLVVTGTLQKKDDTINVIVRDVIAMENARQTFASLPTRTLDDIPPRWESAESGREPALAAISPQSHNYR